MKVFVIYDSQFGNTAKVAEAIGDGFRGAEPPPKVVEVQQVGDVAPASWNAGDLLVVGSPTQRLTMTPAVDKFLKEIPENGLVGVKVAAFDTRLPKGKIREMSAFLDWMVKIFGYAAAPIAKRLERQGGELALPPQGFYVGDMEGPLLEGELERAMAWAEQLLE